MKCNKCGGENAADARFCVFCGNQFETENQNVDSGNEYQQYQHYATDNENQGENFYTQADHQPNGQPYNQQYNQPYNNYNGYNNNYNNFGMMPPSDYERENSTAKTLGVLSIIIGIISILFVAFTVFIGVNYGAIAAFVLAIGAVVKAKPGCFKGLKTAAVIISVIALGLSVLFSFMGNILFKMGDYPELQEFYGDYYNDFYDDFYNDFGDGSQDDFLGGFDENAGNGELV